MMEPIPLPFDEIEFHPLSFCDRDGRVFWWQGELYRGITPAKAAFYRQILESGAVQEIMYRKWLVDTTVTPFTLPGYPLILNHRVLPFVSYANEWCPEMLRDTALLIADMMIELSNHNLTLVGFSTWDLLFDSFRPVYVDFCTIDEADFDGDLTWHLFKDDFHTYLISPLRLMSQGYGNLARWLLADYEHNVIHPELAALLGHPSLYAELNRQFPSWRALSWRNVVPVMAPLVRRGNRYLRNVLMRCGLDTERRGKDLIRDLRQEIERIPLPTITPQPEHDPQRSLTPSDAWTPKQSVVHRLLSDLHPATVLDIGCRDGWYSQLAASLGSQVVALDRDDRQVAACYQSAKDQALQILSLVMDIRYPSPGQGIGNQAIAPALKRLPCDLVLALGLVHLLVFEQHLVFEQIYATLAAFSKANLLVEFIAYPDPEVSQRWPDCPPWYTLETFRDGLERYFQKVNLLTSLTEFRVLLLCHK